MTNEEALEALEVHLSLGHARKEREVTLLAIKALEKQIPKKVLPLNDEWWDYQCPTCGCKFASPADYDYCPACGQRIL